MRERESYNTREIMFLMLSS